MTNAEILAALEGAYIQGKSVIFDPPVPMDLFLDLLKFGEPEDSVDCLPDLVSEAAEFFARQVAIEQCSLLKVARREHGARSQGVSFTIITDWQGKKCSDCPAEYHEGHGWI